MNRATGRWLALGLLAAVVIGLAITTSLSNRRLVEGLVEGDDSSLDIIADRQDAYIFLQSEPVDVRRRVAENLATWDDPRAAKLAITLIPDPDPKVRTNLIASLSRIASDKPKTIAEMFNVGGAAESAALVEASAADPAAGRKILAIALSDTPSSPNAYLLAKRLGSVAEPELIKMLGSGDETVVLAAADALVSVGIEGASRVRVAQTLLTKFTEADSRRFKDKLLPILAHFAQPEARGVFAATALDHTAPSELRAIATSALVDLGDPLVSCLADDGDTAVANAATAR